VHFRPKSGGYRRKCTLGPETGWPDPALTRQYVPVTPTGDVVAQLRAAGCVFAEDEARLLTETAAETGADLADLVAQRVSGTPLEYLLGWTEFHGLRVAVAPGVFVPRQRTAFLVDEAAELARALPTEHPLVVDMCCGSGALGLALATTLASEGRRISLAAADIEPAAVECARRNLTPIGAAVYQGDLFDPLPRELRGRIDILLANTPYVPSEMIAQMPPEARDYEPRTALDGGPDGLDVFRRVVDAARTWLAPGGHLLVESSQAQAPHAITVLTELGFTGRVAESDELYATVVIGTKRAAR
jgi:release factor glutamine methyltransferase